MTDNGSQIRWRTVRRYLNQSRATLTTVAAGLYESPRTESGLIVRPEWLPSRAVPLERVQTTWTPDPPAPRVNGAEPQSFLARPLRGEGRRYARYSEVLAEVDRPAIFEDRPAYRLLGVSVHGGEVGLRFGPGRYFDAIDVSEAVAHELAAASMASGNRGRTPVLGRSDLPLRALVGDPTDFTSRTVVPAVCTLTLRHDSGSGATSFLLHWRDPDRVVSGGGLYQVAPVGVFQPAGSVPDPARPGADPDFDLWRCMAREFHEELLGVAEHAGLDYADWPFGERLRDARDKGLCRPYWLGCGVDPLTLVADLLTVVVFEAAAFDEIFADLVAGNDEGRLLSGLDFTGENVARYARTEPMQPAGAALLELAWRHRDALLG